MRENTPTTAQPLSSSPATARLGLCTKTLLRVVDRGEVAPAYRTPTKHARFRAAAAPCLSSPLEVRIDGA